MANFGQLIPNLIANISGKKQDIVEQKAALQTAISPAHVHLHCSLYLGELWSNSRLLYLFTIFHFQFSAVSSPSFYHL